MYEIKLADGTTTSAAQGIRSSVVCADGFDVSVQASSGHYCSPRDDEGPYTAVEVGFPSERPEPWSEWVAYAEDPDDPTETVYSWVPGAMVVALIQLHDGLAIDNDETREIEA